MYYVKGQGWVYENDAARIVTMKCGRIVRLEFRPPRPGERYDSAGRHNKRYGSSDGSPNIGNWVVSMSGFTYEALIPYPEDEPAYSYPETIFCVCVPV